MARKAKELTEKELAQAGFYEGYDIRWLRELGEEHPDYYLVAEYDEKYPKVEEPEEQEEE